MLRGKEYRGKERRRKERYSTQDLSVCTRSLNYRTHFRRPDQVTPVDFNMGGLSFRSKHVLRLQEALELELRVDWIHLQGVVVMVCNVKQETDGWRYGVKFDFDANDFMRSTQLILDLEEIEQKMKGRSFDNKDYQINDYLNNAERRITGHY